jgi:hypothetical protein
MSITTLQLTWLPSRISLSAKSAPVNATQLSYSLCGNNPSSITTGRCVS